MKDQSIVNKHFTIPAVGSPEMFYVVTTTTSQFILSCAVISIIMHHAASIEPFNEYAWAASF